MTITTYKHTCQLCDNTCVDCVTITTYKHTCQLCDNTCVNCVTITTYYKHTCQLCDNTCVNCVTLTTCMATVWQYMCQLCDINDIYYKHTCQLCDNTCVKITTCTTSNAHLSTVQTICYIVFQLKVLMQHYATSHHQVTCTPMRHTTPASFGYKNLCYRKVDSRRLCLVDLLHCQHGFPPSSEP